MYLTYRMLSKLVHYKKLLIKKFLVKSEPITITSQDILNEQTDTLQSESQRMYYKIPPTKQPYAVSYNGTNKYTVNCNGANLIANTLYYES